eukprot:8662317-Pyramimonas_sp.AAC.1
MYYTPCLNHVWVATPVAMRTCHGLRPTRTYARGSAGVVLVAGMARSISEFYRHFQTPPAPTLHHP